MGNNNEVVITDTDRLLLQKDEEVIIIDIFCIDVSVLEAQHETNERREGRT